GGSKLSALGPLGLPMGITVVGGQRADDGLYVPAIEQAQQTLGQRGLLYVGDCKMAALSTRAYVQQSGDYYLCPLSGVQMSETTLQQLVAPVQANTQALTTIERQSEEDGSLARPRADTDKDRKSTRLNSSHGSISYAVFCLK